MFGPCQLGKQTKAKHPSTQTSATSRPLELLHIDLMGPTRTKSLGGKRYIIVVADDFTRFTWVVLLKSKFDAPEHIEALCMRLQKEKGMKIDQIRNNHGKEFENSYMETCCTKAGISQEFSAPITPQQNGMVERKNRVIQEMAKAMHDELLQFQRNNVWTLVPRLEGEHIIGTNIHSLLPLEGEYQKVKFAGSETKK